MQGGRRENADGAHRAAARAGVCPTGAVLHTHGRLRQVGGGCLEILLLGPPHPEHQLPRQLPSSARRLRTQGGGLLQTRAAFRCCAG